MLLTWKVSALSISHSYAVADSVVRTDLKLALQQIRKVIGEIPMLASEQVNSSVLLVG